MKRMVVLTFTFLLVLFWFGPTAYGLDEIFEPAIDAKSLSHCFEAEEASEREKATHALQIDLERALQEQGVRPSAEVFTRTGARELEFYFVVEVRGENRQMTVQSVRVVRLSDEQTFFFRDRARLSLSAIEALTKKLEALAPAWRKKGSEGLSLEEAQKLTSSLVKISSAVQAEILSQLPEGLVREKAERTVIFSPGHALQFQFVNPPVAPTATVIFTLLPYWDKDGRLQGFGFRVSTIAAGADPTRRVGQRERSFKGSFLRR